MRNKRNIPNLNVFELENLINKWVFSERDRNILKRRLIDGVHFEPLAEEFKLSPQNTKRIVYKSIEELMKHI